MRIGPWAFTPLLFGCTSGVDDSDTDVIDTGAVADTDADTDTDVDTDVGADPYADQVVSFAPGEGSGFGQDGYPDVVLGSPQGNTTGNGATHVLSLGREGEIVLAFDDIVLVDGEGVDLIVFENPFVGWAETGRVAVSDDGETWSEWPCDPLDAEGGYPGCAGVAPAYAGPDGTDPTDPAVAGGDQYDLASIGAPGARYVRIRDTGANSYDGIAGGFDLDAVAIVNGAALE